MGWTMQFRPARQMPDNDSERAWRDERSFGNRIAWKDRGCRYFPSSSGSVSGCAGEIGCGIGCGCRPWRAVNTVPLTLIS